MPITYRFDWLNSQRESINPSREAISIPSGKYKRFTFVHPVVEQTMLDNLTTALLLCLSSVSLDVLHLALQSLIDENRWACFFTEPL